MAATSGQQASNNTISRPQHPETRLPLSATCKMQGAGVADKPFHILNIRFVGLGDTV